MEVIRGVRRVGIMAMVVMVVFAGHATASWESCYGPCFLKCMVNSKKLFSCAFKCLKQCVFRPASNPLYYCSLGCSMNECAELSNDSERMESCVENCTSNICSPKQ
ncbi:hypothetical protein AAG906_004567 [Vitis piasezkii]